MATRSVVYSDPRGALLVKGYAKTGTKVNDADGEPLGRVTELVGNVKDPYMLISGRRAAKKVVVEG